MEGDLQAEDAGGAEYSSRRALPLHSTNTQSSHRQCPRPRVNPGCHGLLWQLSVHIAHTGQQGATPSPVTSHEHPQPVCSRMPIGLGWEGLSQSCNR